MTKNDAPGHNDGCPSESKGETPMTANGSGSRIRVFDESGEMIGTTFPKRARGLVKNGRARWLADETNASDPVMIPEMTNESEEEEYEKAYFLRTPRHLREPDTSVTTIERCRPKQTHDPQPLIFTVTVLASSSTEYVPLPSNPVVIPLSEHLFVPSNVHSQLPFVSSSWVHVPSIT